MEEKLKPFIEEYSDDFYESIEDIRQYLMKYNKNYREIKNKIHKIMDRNLNIQKSFDELSKGRTTLIIAHRLSTIKNSDCIAVVGDKEILESGTHDELIKLNGVYAKLYQNV